MTPTELAARRYVDAWLEPDRERRAALLEACFTADGRIFLAGQVLRGRAVLAAAIDAFFVDPRRLTAALSSAIDAGGQTFRFRARVRRPDGALHAELFDAGEVGSDGRITALYTFTEPLAAADPSAPPASPVERAAQAYVDLWAERDPAARRATLAACFASDGRMVARDRTYRGLDELTAVVDAALADPRGLIAQRSTAIELNGSAFRFGSRGTFSDGSPGFEGIDVGEVDASGRIEVLYVFGGPLGPAADAG
jgi:hypothetical protein